MNRRLIAMGVRTLCGTTCIALLAAWPATGQLAQMPEKMNPGEHQHAHHHLHIPMGEEKCEATYTYQEEATGPGQWTGVCATGKMQAPIDIKHSQKLPIDIPKFNYQPAPLDIINDCNQYRVLVKFPDNYWLTVGKKPYNLAEIHFRVPGENAVNGKRPPMSVQFVHYSPEGVFLIVEVPVVAGKENAALKTLWANIPERGKEKKVEGARINPADLLPENRSFYRFPGSLTTPICNEVVTWYVMKHPIEMSEAQIAEYASQYHDAARPLPPLNGRPVVENP